jgi:hypothetical protein
VPTVTEGVLDVDKAAVALQAADFFWHYSTAALN